MFKHISCPTLTVYTFSRLLVELDGVAKRQVRASIFQRKLGSFSKVSADVAKISASLGELSMSSMVRTHSHYRVQYSS